MTLPIGYVSLQQRYPAMHTINAAWCHLNEEIESMTLDLGLSLAMYDAFAALAPCWTEARHSRTAMNLEMHGVTHVPQGDGSPRDQS